MAFSITLSDVVIPEFCPVFGMKLVRSTGKPTHASPTLDRIDNAVGYVPGNVAVISYRANWLKNNATADELEKIAKYVRASATN